MSSYALKELYAMAKHQGIKYICFKGKAELCQLLNIPFEGINDHHKYLQTIHRKPKAITLTNCESNEEHNFNSIYKCSQHFKVNPGLFGMKKKCSKGYSNWIVIKGVKFLISYPSVPEYTSMTRLALITN